MAGAYDLGELVRLARSRGEAVARGSRLALFDELSQRPCWRRHTVINVIGECDVVPLPHASAPAAYYFEPRGGSAAVIVYSSERCPGSPEVEAIDAYVHVDGEWRRLRLRVASRRPR